MKDKKVENVKVDESPKTNELKKVEETQKEKEKKDWDETRQAFPIVVLVLLVPFLLYQGYSFFHSINERKNVLNHELKQSELVLADPVRRNNVKQIKTVLKEHPEIIEDSKKIDYYFSIMQYALIYRKYDAVKTLLEEGYYPDAGGSSIGFLTAYYNHSPFDYLPVLYGPKPWLSEDNIKYIKLLLEYNAAVKANLMEGCPLSRSAAHVIGDKKEFPVVKLLVEEGHCDVNYTGCSNFPPACFALKEKNIYAAHYLIVKHKTDLTGECARLATCALLPQLECAPGSEEEKLKQEIIQELKNQGIDYEPTDDFIFRSNQDFKSLLPRLAQKAQEEKNWWSEYEATSYFLRTR
ncbi:MAG: hypothetical protein J6X54_08340 [Treponema sp.]|nr:hypothetical protein [Treponema sp.]